MATDDLQSGSPPAPLRLTTLRKRADFLHLASAGKKWVTPGFVIQTAAANQPEQINLGLTATKKVGNAVQRNRARRRLRALAHEILPLHALPGHAFVLIARETATASRDYAELKKDLLWALKRLEVRRG